VASILLEDQRALFELPHEERFAALGKVDWEVSLIAAATKTHREVHSLWGVFASTHRIWLLHSLLFFLGACIVAPVPPEKLPGDELLFGRATKLRYATVMLVVPAHAVLWWVARWQTTGVALRPSWEERVAGMKGGWAMAWFREVRQQSAWGRVRMIFFTPPDIFALFPIGTYIALRIVDEGEDSLGIAALVIFIAHSVVSIFALLHLLFVPATRFMVWELTPVRKRSRFVRYFFWSTVLAAKFMLGLLILSVVQEAIGGLKIARPGHHTLGEVADFAMSTLWWSNVLVWFVLWSTAFLLFTADTQIWFTIGCTVLGVLTVFKQRAVLQEGPLLLADEEFGEIVRQVLSHLPAGLGPRRGLHALRGRHRQRGDGCAVL